MTLDVLVREALGLNARLPRLEVTGISQDHRKVMPGHVFVARVGGRVDGHRYVRLAIERGAIAVVGIRETKDLLPWGATPYIRVENDRAAVARLAAVFHSHPSRVLKTIGVTGTDGKTTVSFLLHHLLAADFRCGLMSTAGVRLPESELPLEGHFTTPEATEVQAYLAAFRDANCSHAVLESSSHALSLHRLDEVEYDLAVWTNLSAEHLDHHGSLEAYRDAKLELLRRSGCAVLNLDDEHFPAFEEVADEVVTYGTHPAAKWRASAIRQTPGRLHFDLHMGNETRPASLPMLGAFNVHNALAALAAADACGVDRERALLNLERFPGVPGRMQVIHSAEFSVVVDFAHTGPALEKALAALRPAVSGRIILVVGAAGERDPGKREPLGRAAAAGADLVYFTEEDHRSESLDQILDQLELAARRGGMSEAAMRRIPDRREAIEEAIGEARSGDLVLLAGKGHESTLERGSDAIPWDEAAEARRHLG